jgi:hypothetical protein
MLRFAISGVVPAEAIADTGMIGAVLLLGSVSVNTSRGLRALAKRMVYCCRMYSFGV